MTDTKETAFRRTQFTFYESFYTALGRIRGKEARLAVYEALAAYALYGETPDFSGAPESVRVAFELIRPNLEAGRRKALSGSRGGSAGPDREERDASKGEDKKETETKKEKETEYKSKDKTEGAPPKGEGRGQGAPARAGGGRRPGGGATGGRGYDKDCFQPTPERIQRNDDELRSFLSERKRREQPDFQPTPERIQANADWLDRFLAEQEAASAAGGSS